MNLKAIDAALAAYRDKLDDADNARLSFFRELWEAQDEIAAQAATAYDVPDAASLKDWAREGLPVLSQAPVPLDGAALAQAMGRIAEALSAHGGFAPSASEALARTNWERLVAASDLAAAGSDPARYVEEFAELLADDGCAEDAASIGATATSLALRALLEGPATAVEQARRAAGADEPHSVRCPVCGGEAAVAQVSGAPAGQGRGKRLWCAQCGCAWDFERVRCARCGTQNQGHLHYFNLEGDEAHRLATCDECGGYTRTVYEEDALAPFSFEVEDVVMAKLDLVAYQRAAADAAAAEGADDAGAQG